MGSKRAGKLIKTTAGSGSSDLKIWRSRDCGGWRGRRGCGGRGRCGDQSKIDDRHFVTHTPSYLQLLLMLQETKTEDKYDEDVEKIFEVPAERKKEVATFDNLAHLVDLKAE